MHVFMAGGSGQTGSLVIENLIEQGMSLVRHREWQHMSLIMGGENRSYCYGIGP
jgi:hypothetical protein